MQYSIWVIPPEPIYTRLKTIIIELAKTYNGPTFEPHLTLLGNINKELTEIESKVQGLAVNIDELEINLGPISFSTTYFQSVFVRVNSKAQLMKLNLDIKKALNIENNVFMPHISLIYGNHDMETREKIAAKIKPMNFSFITNELFIIPTKPEPSDWEPLATIPFKTKS